MTRPPLALQLINRKTTKNVKKEIIWELGKTSIGYTRSRKIFNFVRAQKLPLKVEITKAVLFEYTFQA